MSSPACAVLALGAFSQPAFAAPPGFTEATIAEAVNAVDVLSGPSARPARIREKITCRETLRTGAKSRAELAFPDATIARVGANSVFSFRPDQRAFDLKQGCVLFHSPKGHGGGQIHTASVTAAVTGTTIIVAATRNGGFKILVLEGSARSRMPNGRVVLPKAGQMAYVLPNSNQIPPPLNFHLLGQVQGSDLVRGFSTVLPSMPLINAAVAQQQALIQQGDLSVTGFLIGDMTADSQVSLVPVNAQIISAYQNTPPDVPPQLPSPPVQPAGPTRYDYAVANDSVITFSPTTPLDPLHTIGLYELDNPQNFYDLCVATYNQAGVAPDYPFDAGFGARDIDFNNPTLDLSAFNPGEEFTFAALGQARIHGGLTVSGFYGEVELFSHMAPLIDAGSVIDIADASGFQLDSDAPFSLNNVQINVPAGACGVYSETGLTINNSASQSMLDANIWADSVDITGTSFQVLGTANYMNIAAQTSLSLDNVQVSVPDGSCFIGGGDGLALTINNSSFQSMYNTEIHADSVDVTGTSFQILDTATPSMVHIDAYANGAGGPVTLTDITLNGARLDVDYSSAFTLSGAAPFDGSSLRVYAKAIDVSGIGFSPSLPELDLRQTDPWNLVSPALSAQKLSVASESDLTLNFGIITGGEVFLGGESSLNLVQTSVSEQNSAAPDLYLGSSGNIDVTAGSQISSMAAISLDGLNVTVDNSTLSTDMDVGQRINIFATGNLTFKNAGIHPRLNLDLNAVSIDSTGGTVQAGGQIFANASSIITVNGGTWDSGVTLNLQAPSISTFGLIAGAFEGINFNGDNTLVQGGSLTTYDTSSSASGVWIQGNTAATVDGATITSARDANVHGGQINLVNASINVNNTDPIRQVFVNGSGPVSIQNTTIAGTGPVNIQGATLDLLSGQITSGTAPGYDQVSLTATAASGLLNVNGTAFASQQIRMQADTIRLENINFPGGSSVDLDSRLGYLAPGANTQQPVVPGAVNYYNGVKYNGTLLDNTPHLNINIH